MTSVAIEGPLDASDELPDDLFDRLAPHGAPVAVAMPKVDAVADLLASLPALPSLKGYETRLTSIQTALDEAREEAQGIREELRAKAELLRKLASALESV